MYINKKLLRLKDVYFKIMKSNKKKDCIFNVCKLKLVINKLDFIF